MANFSAYYMGTNIESVSHPKDLAEAKRYFKKRYKQGQYPLVVISCDASQEEIRAAIKKSNTMIEAAPQVMSFTEVIAQSKLEEPGVFTVALSSTGNPDYGQTPGRSLPGVRKRKAKVGSLAEASKVCRQYIEENDLGGGNWDGGFVTQDDKVVAYVSYNGRVWQRPA